MKLILFLILLPIVKKLNKPEIFNKPETILVGMPYRKQGLWRKVSKLTVDSIQVDYFFIKGEGVSALKNLSWAQSTF